MKRLVPVLLMAVSILGGCSPASNHSSAVPENRPESVPVAKIKKYYAYAAAQYTNKIHQFSISETSGELTPLAVDSIDAQSLPMITAVSADKKILVASNYSSNSVSSYLIDPATGNLILAEHHALPATSAPGWVSAHPSLPIFYTADSGTGKISILDAGADGLLTLRGSVNAGAGATCVVINHDASLLYSVDQGANQISVYNIDSDGNLTFSSTVSTGAGTQPNQGALSPDGRFFYTANWGTQSVSAFAVSDGNLSAVGSSVSAGTGGVYTVSISPDGTKLYAAKPYGGGFSEHALDPVTGAVGAANVNSLAGSVSFTFWKEYAFLVSWSGAAAGVPIETRTYSATNGLSAGPTSATSLGYQGLYQLTVVELEVDP